MKLAGVEVTRREAATLERYGFDPNRFAELQAKVKRDGADALTQLNEVRGNITPLDVEDITELATLGAEKLRALDQEGRTLIREGKVGAIVLAGGMATRFGGVVKGVVQVAEGQSFLDLKTHALHRVASSCSGKVPIYLMTSFATHDILEHEAKRLTTAPCPMRCFPQNVSVRLHTNGELFVDGEGAPSLYAPGHGDLGEAFKRSGMLDAFVAEGGELLFVSNVDNLLATLDPVLVALHRRKKVALSAEVVSKWPGDVGGAPARVDGKAQIIEAFRFPKHFDQSRISTFNTNTFVFDAAVLMETYPLDFFAAQKKVDGHEVIQFERLVGQLTAFVPSHFLHVARSGEDARFQPIKVPADLEESRDHIMQTLVERLRSD